MFKKTAKPSTALSGNPEAASLDIPRQVTLASTLVEEIFTVQAPAFKTGSEYNLYRLQSEDTGHFSHVLRVYKAPLPSTKDILLRECRLIKQTLGEGYLWGHVSRAFFVMPNVSPSLRDYLQDNLMAGLAVVKEKRLLILDVHLRYLFVLNALFDLSNALHAFHAQTGCVHLDLKDTNAVYCGSRPSMTLIDFGQSIERGEIPTKITESHDQSSVARAQAPRARRERSRSEIWALDRIESGEIRPQAEFAWDEHALGRTLVGRRAGEGWLPEFLGDDQGDNSIFSGLGRVESVLSKQANPHLKTPTLLDNLLADESDEDDEENLELLGKNIASDGWVQFDELNMLEKVSKNVSCLLKQHMWAIESEHLWRRSVAQVFSSNHYSSFHSVHERRLQMAYYAFLTGGAVRDYVASPAVSFFGLSAFVKAVQDVWKPELELRDQAWSMMRALCYGAAALITLPFTLTRNLLKLVFECVPAYLSAASWKQAEKEQGRLAVLCYTAWGFFKMLQVIFQQILSPLNAAQMWSALAGGGGRGRIVGVLSLAVSLLAIGIVFNIIMPFVAFFVAMNSPVWWLTQALSAAHIKVSFVQVFTTLCNKINIFHFLDKLIHLNFLSQAKDYAKVVGQHCAGALGNVDVSHCIVEAALPVVATERLMVGCENKLLYGSFFGYNANSDTDQSLRLKSKAKRGEENFNVVDEFQLTPVF